MSEDITIETIVGLAKSMAQPSLVGMAISPQAKSLLDRAQLQSFVPTLVDPRLSIDRSELFFNDVEWRIRVHEQQKWEESVLPKRTE